MHMTVLVELPASTAMTDDGVSTALEQAMEPFYSDCSGGYTETEEGEYNELDRDDWTCGHRGHYWDWYQIGGRWRDFFQPVPEPSDRILSGAPGVPEAFAIRKGEAVLEVTGADVIRKRDIDWERMAAARLEDAKKNWDAYEQDNKYPEDVKYFVYGIEKGETRDGFLQRIGSADDTTYAVLTARGEWYSSETWTWDNEKKDGQFIKTEAWPKRWAEIVAAMPDDAILALVDYHN